VIRARLGKKVCLVILAEARKKSCLGAQIDKGVKTTFPWVGEKKRDAWKHVEFEERMRWRRARAVALNGGSREKCKALTITSAVHHKPGGKDERGRTCFKGEEGSVPQRKHS